jgi:hypothetical protein
MGGVVRLVQCSVSSHLVFSQKSLIKYPPAITMAKKEKVKTLVYGGKAGITQEYCGTVGGESTVFPVIDTDLKTTGLKSDPLAPPDFLTNSLQGITIRLAYGVWDTQQPEEWQDHKADYTLPLTTST